MERGKFQAKCPILIHRHPPCGWDQDHWSPALLSKAIAFWLPLRCKRRGDARGSLGGMQTGDRIGLRHEPWA